ncbi:4-(cytidine 5'-diphospho)-2-C-methyl-D-erythritol kinase [Flexibacterium corallicola]|uniref:4-(cytidine 5'-diphospho)-2-C-methyl-D-erythritol kinase n=1 Tax=Flexibacterium corallicola TaxID=3037259 RepID=UPI00286F0B23|nr:4-(cytidine 5'-diphospho)-2-C-methyl-D-erythritol kinase [Pseudovibrio sp. M1P-2-3]
MNFDFSAAPVKQNHVEELARAKVNLALHVTGIRENGYHTLDSLVVFPKTGDLVRVEAADQTSLDIIGPFADQLDSNPANNLVFRAAQLLAELVPTTRGAMIGLYKRLPVAAGVGGGSADAAATLRALSKVWGISPSTPELESLALQLGADVPMCIAEQPMRIKGIGEILEPIPPMPAAAVVLVNPGFSLSTPEVFLALKEKKNSGLPPLPHSFGSAFALAEWLKSCRNDLQEPAIHLVPQIKEILELLEVQHETLLARMTGSGATCFALCNSLDDAEALESRLRSNRRDWWIVSAPL